MAGETVMRGSNSIAAPIIIDIGKKSRKSIKQLRDGQGKLLQEVNDCIKELREAGKISGSAQPVVVVVRQKQMLSDMLDMDW